MIKDIARFYYFKYSPWKHENLPFYFQLHFHLPANSKINTVKLPELLEILAKQDNAKPIIPFEEVQSWFTKSLFEITISEAQELAIFLNAMILTKSINIFTPFPPMTNILNSCRELSDNLPEGIQFITNKIENFSASTDKNSIRAHKKLLKHLQKIQGEINQLKNEEHLTKKKNIYFWHQDAVVIAKTIYDYGMRRSIRLSYKQTDSQLIKIVKLALERTHFSNFFHSVNIGIHFI